MSSSSIMYALVVEDVQDQATGELKARGLCSESDLYKFAEPARCALFRKNRTAIIVFKKKNLQNHAVQESSSVSRNWEMNQSWFTHDATLRVGFQVYISVDQKGKCGNNRGSYCLHPYS